MIRTRYAIKLTAVRLSTNDEGELVPRYGRVLKVFIDYSLDGLESSAEAFSFEVCRRFPVSVEANLTVRQGNKVSRRLLFRVINKPLQDGQQPETIKIVRYLTDGTSKVTDIQLVSREVALGTNT